MALNRTDDLEKKYQSLWRENIFLKTKMEKLQKKINELENNLELQRQSNPGLNPNGLFTVNIKNDNNLVKEDLNDLLLWVCDNVHRSISSLTELDSNLKNVLNLHPDHQLALHGKVYSPKCCTILPVLIGSDGQINELGFVRESCNMLAEKTMDLFQLSTQLKRWNAVNQDNPNYSTQYQIGLTEEAINELRAIQKGFLHQLKV